MRHKRKTVKLQRTKSHREALLKNLCKSLIEHRRIKTTLAKAKALRPVAEKLVTLGKKFHTVEGKNAQETAATKIHYTRQAFAVLRSNDLVKKLFNEIAAASKDRVGGYTRITKLGQRMTDSAPMAFIEWVDAFVGKSSDDAIEADAVVVGDDAPAAEATEEAKPAKKRAAKKKIEE
jgi:large subunit ribosomal protein L17